MRKTCSAQREGNPKKQKRMSLRKIAVTGWVEKGFLKGREKGKPGIAWGGASHFQERERWAQTREDTVGALLSEQDLIQ